MNRTSAPSDCASVAPLLTELFDGEADAQTAAAARAHLLSCENCARLWLDWNQHRNILRNDNVPAPPPTQLWRVLVACRASGHVLPNVAPQPTLHQLEAPLPAHLSARILSRTSRKSNRGAMLTPTAPAAFGPRWRVRRWSLMAAPALALWLLLLGRTDFNAALAPQNFDETMALSEKSGAAPIQKAKVHVSQSAKNSLVVAKLGFAPLAPVVLNEVVRPAVATPRAARSMVAISRAPRIAFDSERRERAELNQIFAVALRTVRRERAEVPVAPREVPVAPRIESRVPAARPIGASRTEFAPRHVVSTLPPETAARPRGVPLRRSSLQLAALPASPRIIITVAARLHPASFSETPGAPRARLALLSDSTPALRELVGENPQKLRVSRPAPVSPAVRVASLSANDNNGPRIEELRSAVDDFRAAVSNTTGGDGWDG